VKAIVLIAALALLGQACASASGVYLSTAADVATSQVIIRGGGVETNPILRHPLPVVVVIEAVTAYAVVRYSQHLRAEGRNWRLPLRIFSAIHFSAAGFNAAQIAKH
jgi:hypothetical protein